MRYLTFNLVSGEFYCLLGRQSDALRGAEESIRDLRLIEESGFVEVRVE